MTTHTFKLPSGVECEVKPLIGKHQRMLTEQKNSNLSENLNEVLADVITRVGSNTNIDKQFVLGMLAIDRKKALVEVRQFTMDFEPTFVFDYDYKNRLGEKASFPFQVDLSDGFNEVPLKKWGKLKTDEGETETWIDCEYKEYAEIEKTIYITLPKSGSEVRFNLLDGHGELRGMTTPKNQRSSHTAILMRNPQYKAPTKKGGDVWIQLNLDNLPYKDIEILRATIKQVEGSIDTEFIFEHPEAEFKSAGEKDVTVDLVGQLAFFFPSQAI